MMRASVVIPVKDGERYLEELLESVLAQSPDEVLVIDSGSRDRSPEISRAMGAEVMQIPPESFGHGRTRNLGAESTTGELICFLTQDATPCHGWLAAHREAFSLADDVGAAYGPHLPRPGTSPMIARELLEFFSGFATDGEPTVQRQGDPSFLSNVNASYLRRAWEEIHFRDVPYSEDQAFGSDLLAAGWAKVYHPSAAVLHAHDYPWTEFMRRYFDEYRGLRDSIGHVESFSLLRDAGDVSRRVRQDLQFMAASDSSRRARIAWASRSAAHHGGRKVFSALGSRAGSLPPPIRRRLSLEGRDEAPPATPRHPLPTPRAVSPRVRADDYAVAAEVWREGPAPLLPPREDVADRERLRIAMLLPPFRKGSGGHNTLLQLLTRLESRGHACSVWMHDYFRSLDHMGEAVLRHDIREWFAPLEGPVHKGFQRWHGADVALATGWQTVHPALRLPNCFARAYIVNDHEPEFYPSSVERLLAADTYRHGLHCIAASPWLRDLLQERYGASADAFQLGVDHDVYHPHDEIRRRDTVVYYARHSTDRRAVPLGLMALSELHRRRPDVRIVLFGIAEPVETTFPYEHYGILDGEQLARLYSQATVGLCLSLTNFSLMPKEMLACGLPCVELAGISAESIFGDDGPLLLAPPEPDAIAVALESLLDDRQAWLERSARGRAFVSTHSWEAATDQVESAIRRALRLRCAPQAGG